MINLVLLYHKISILSNQRLLSNVEHVGTGSLLTKVTIFIDLTNNFDYVFWCGDLNFRLGEPRAAVLRWIEKTQVSVVFKQSVFNNYIE